MDESNPHSPVSPENMENPYNGPFPDYDTVATTPGSAFGHGPTSPALNVDEIAFAFELEETGLMDNVCIVGAGYVGGPTAAVLALQNPLIKFTVLDKDPLRIAQWKSKHLPIYEPDLHTIVRICRDGTRTMTPFLQEPGGRLTSTFGLTHVPAREPNLFFTTDILEALHDVDMVIIAINIPVKTEGHEADEMDTGAFEEVAEGPEAGELDMSSFEKVVRAISDHTRNHTIIVGKSTVPCGISDYITDLLHSYHEDPDYVKVHPFLSCPEFLSAGNAVHNILFPSRIVIGADESDDSLEGRRLYRHLHRWVPSSHIVHTSIATAELSKLASNAMLAQRISAVNSIAAICEETGADIQEVVKVVGMDERIGAQYLKAGIGYGGGCLGKDMKILEDAANQEGWNELSGFWGGVREVNEWMVRMWLEKVKKSLVKWKGKKLVLAGWAFKSGTGDSRGSVGAAALRIILGGALGRTPRKVIIWDDTCEIGDVGEEVAKIKEEVLKEAVVSLDITNNLAMACEGAHALLICRELEDPKFHEGSKFYAEMTKDPRPFTKAPTEIQLLQLNRHINSVMGKGGVRVADNDALDRLNPEVCEKDCMKCLKARLIAENGGGGIDWRNVLKGLKEPKWIFDGRNSLDKEVMEKIAERMGFEIRLVGVGRPGPVVKDQKGKGKAIDQEEETEDKEEEMKDQEEETKDNEEEARGQEEEASLEDTLPK